MEVLPSFSNCTNHYSAKIKKQATEGWEWVDMVKNLLLALVQVYVSIGEL